MRYIKIYESYTPEQYQKALLKIGDWIRKSKPNEEILMYINSLTGDSGKALDQLRILFNRISRELEYRKRYIHYNPKTNPQKRTLRDTYYNTTIYDIKYFYCWEPNKKSDGYPSFPTGTGRDMSMYYDYEYKKYLSLIESISKDKDISNLLFLCNRFFEIFKWCVDFNTKKHDILRSSDTLITPENKIRQIDDLNDELEMENEVEEIQKLLTRIQYQIKKLNSQ